ncbi:MAG: 7-carboxy-7-deazaguanine synthase QueE [Chlorobia bacterium]|nr:7-carboxy-7-deazaguanine synthase QueE [Fimbriimonadaceae bacterium]
MGKLRISEIFASVQGEGIWVGVPSVFVRTSGCNLRCSWCDTPYASWNPEGPIVEVRDIIAEVERHQIDHVVLTGGEPMIFDPIVELAATLKELGHTITIETAGTFHRDLPCDLMSISPKLANSTPPPESGFVPRHETIRLDRTPLSYLMDAYHCQLKFVVNPDQPGDLEEIDDLLQNLPPIEPSRILLMAEGIDSETLNRRMKALVPICISRNWRLTPRLHVDLFGNTRGT